MFPTVNGARYIPFLKRLHARHLFDWYMEIGCRTGASFAGVRGKTIAVDPYFRVTDNVIGVKPALHIFQQTSDDFFDSGALTALKAKINFAFLDGMHLFEFLLRDIINTEKHAAPGAIIALHDCIPTSLEMTTREINHSPRTPWAGDVWKLIPILQQHRPTMKIEVLDCRPTGLVLLSNLSPRSGVLSKAYDQILADWTDTTLDSYGVDRFFDSFDFVSSADEQKADFPRFAKIARPEDSAPQPEYVTP